jgi:hypothetical protein
MVWAKSILRNEIAQFGRPKGAVVGSDISTFTLGSKVKGDVKVAATLPEEHSGQREGSAEAGIGADFRPRRNRRLRRCSGRGRKHRAQRERFQGAKRLPLTAPLTVSARTTRWAMVAIAAASVVVAAAVPGYQTWLIIFGGVLVAWASGLLT